MSARGYTYWAVCVWDALGIPALVNVDAMITIQAADRDQKLVLEVRDRALVHSEGVVHFGVPAARWWDNIGFA